MMVVAVPMKYRLAFSPPALVGCTLTSLAAGNALGIASPLGWSLRGGFRSSGLIWRWFMIECHGGRERES